MAQETRPKDYPKLKRYKPEKDSANMSCDAKVHFIFVLNTFRRKFIGREICNNALIRRG